MDKKLLQQALDAFINTLSVGAQANVRDSAKRNESHTVDAFKAGYYAAIAQPVQPAADEIMQQEADKGVFSLFNACMYKEQCRAAIAQPATAMPNLPGHPESNTFTWSDFELQTIAAYGKKCFDAGRAQPKQLDFEIIGYQFQWTNPANNTDHDGVMTKWSEVVPDWNQTVQQKIDQLLAYRYLGKPTYRVRVLYTTTGVAQPEQPAEAVKPKAQTGDAADARRYRFIRANSYIEIVCDSPKVAGWIDADTDRAIDAAIAQHAQPEQPVTMTKDDAWYNACKLIIEHHVLPSMVQSACLHLEIMRNQINKSFDKDAAAIRQGGDA